MDFIEFLRALGTPLAVFIGLLVARRIEIAKLDTRLEKLDQIEIEMQRITRAQEEVKHEISSREWKRSWRREAYVGFMAAAQTFAIYQDDSKATVQQATAKRDTASLQRAMAVLGEFQILVKQLAHTYSLCLLVAPDPVSRAARQLWDATRADRNAESWSKDFKAALNSYSAAVRTDLGLKD